MNSEVLLVKTFSVTTLLSSTCIQTSALTEQQNNNRTRTATCINPHTHTTLHTYTEISTYYTIIHKEMMMIPHMLPVCWDLVDVTWQAFGTPPLSPPGYGQGCHEPESTGQGPSDSTPMITGQLLASLGLCGSNLPPDFFPHAGSAGSFCEAAFLAVKGLGTLMFLSTTFKTHSFCSHLCHHMTLSIWLY